MILKNILIKEILGKGKGLVANEEIKEGDDVITFLGPILTKSKAKELNKFDHVLPVGIDSYMDIGQPDSLINHSCDPNTGFRTDTTLVALRSISKGEELTFDYSLIGADGWKIECNCGSKECRGIVGDYKDFPTSLKFKYASITPKWVIALEN